MASEVLAEGRQAAMLGLSSTRGSVAPLTPEVRSELDFHHQRLADQIEALSVETSHARRPVTFSASACATAVLPTPAAVAGATQHRTRHRRSSVDLGTAANAPALSAIPKSPSLKGSVVQGAAKLECSPAQTSPDPWAALLQEKQYYSLSSRARRQVRRMSHEGTRPWLGVEGIVEGNPELREKGMTATSSRPSSEHATLSSQEAAVGAYLLREAWQQRRQRRQQRTAESCAPIDLDEDL